MANTGGVDADADAGEVVSTLRRLWASCADGFFSGFHESRGGSPAPAPAA